VSITGIIITYSATALKTRKSETGPLAEDARLLGTSQVSLAMANVVFAAEDFDFEAAIGIGGAKRLAVHMKVTCARRNRAQAPRRCVYNPSDGPPHGRSDQHYWYLS
jgi:hypothetical protein